MTLLDEVHQLLEEMGFASRTQGRPSADALPSSSQTEKADKAFAVSLLIKDFSPEELSVKVVGRKLLVTGTKTTRTKDEKGAYSYKNEIFRREWDVPKDLNPEELVCSVYSDGQLRIGRPCLALPTCTERTVPIQFSPTITPVAGAAASGDERTVTIQLSPEIISAAAAAVASGDERTVPIQLSPEIASATAPSSDERTVPIQLSPEIASATAPSSDERTVPIQLSPEIASATAPSSDERTVPIQLSPEIEGLISKTR
uniref:Heat shock protein beta-11-like n=1 Tax=Geotrypetes seraphini TaxID=260995 RepID=A0A6P8NC20_GEOSA|nr:heat shock protein beta-11-like [Geotrypetes seraphini]